MYYKEFLRVRNFVIWLTVWLGVILVAHAALHLFVPVMNSNSSGPTNFGRFFEVAALVIGGIVATNFGSTLARENDGHLEVTWTRPYSRSEYATAAMLMNAAGIMFCVLMGFAAFVLIWYTPGMFIPGMRAEVTWNLGPSTVIDLLRSALFPLAWYAVIVALSARLRGGGLVQGLIWPLALVLLVLYRIPFAPVMHNLFAVLNIVNPLIYIGDKDSSFWMAGPESNAAIFAVVALALITVGGWALATMQWRRLEA